MFRKKLLIFGIISVSMLSLVACGDTKNEKSESKSIISNSSEEKTTTYNIDSLLKKHPISFDGFNQNNIIYFDDDIFTIESIESNVNNKISNSIYYTTLSNGDKINVKINPDYNPSNSFLKGDDSKTIRVSDLKDTKNLSSEIGSITLDNLIDNIKSSLPEVGDTDPTYYTNNKIISVDVIASYFVNNSVNGYRYAEDSNVSDDLKKYKPAFSIMTIYKVDYEVSLSVFDGTTNFSKYKILGFNNLFFSNNSVAIPQSTEELEGSYDSLDEAINTLKKQQNGISPDVVKIQ